MRRKLMNVKMVGVVAVLLALIMAVGVAEEERTDASGQWKYVLEDASATITEYVGEPPEDLVFPSELDGYPVTAIDRWLSGDAYIANVTIPDGVTRIGAGAFADHANEWSGFSSLTIPDSVVSIGDSAFYYCRSLTAVTIPAGVTDIGKNPFEGCPMIHIDVAAGNPVYEQVDGVLFDKQQKMLVSYPHARGESYAIPEGVLRIGDGAFSNNYNLTGVIIPDSVTHIGSMAFWACVGLTCVTIPDSVSSIGDMAFKECDNLTSVIVPDSVTSIGEEAFGWHSGVTLSVKEGSYAEQYAEENGIPYTYGTAEEEDAATSGQWKYVLEDGGATITGYAKEPSGDLVIPGEIDGYPVTGIGESAFEECDGITSVTIPEGVTSVGDYAFWACKGITSATVPKGVTNIGKGVFSSCKSLTSVTIPDSVTSISDGAFEWCGRLTGVAIPVGVVSIGERAFAYCEGLASITIPKSVTSIGISAFVGCTGLTSVAIPEGVERIRMGTFHGCTGLTSVTIPESVTFIGSSAFNRCTGLTSLTIPYSVTNIEYMAFVGCDNLTLSVAKGSYAEEFAKENEIPFVYDENSATAQAEPSGAESEDSSSGVAEAPIAEERPEERTAAGGWWKYVLEDGGAMITGYAKKTSWDTVIPDELDGHTVTGIGKEAFQDCLMTKVTIPVSVTNMRADSFAKCFVSSVKVASKNPVFEDVKGVLFDKQQKALVFYPRGKEDKRYAVPKGTLLIGERAFFECTGLTSVTLSSTVTGIGDEAFRGCYNLKSVTIPKKVTAIGREAFR